MKINKHFVILLTVLLFFSLEFIVFLELHRFKLWPQVTTLWEGGFKLVDVLSHPHGLRYLLIYPIFLVSSNSGVHYDLIFSVIACFLIAAIFLMIVLTTMNIKGNIDKKVLIVFFFLFVIAVNMNGRLVFALLGSSIFLYIVYSKLSGLSFYFLSFFSFLLSSVSSGTLSVFLSWFILYWTFFKNKSITENVIGGTACVLFFYFIFDFIVLFVKKNIDYFGGGGDGIVNMLSHGPGRLFLIDIDIAVLVFFNLISLFFLMLVFLVVLGLNIFSSITIMTLLFLSFGIAFGMFGFSTALYSTPLYLIIYTSFKPLFMNDSSLDFHQKS